MFKPKTIREAVAVFGGPAHLGVEENDPILDVPISETFFASTPGTAALQFHCGGDCLITFVPVGLPGVRPIYIVYDDHDGERWEREKINPMQQWRPHPRLRLVRSA